MVEVFWTILTLAMLAVALSSLAGFLGRAWWVFDLLSHFRVQYVLLLLVVAVVFIVGNKLVQAFASLAFAFLNLGMILPIYRQTTPHFRAIKPTGRENNPGHSEPPVYRLLLANVLQQNQEYARVRQLIGDADPALILLVEINTTWVEELQPILAQYPYFLKPLREDNYGLGLFSKLPFASVESVEFGEAKVPSVLARIPLDGQTLTVIGTHPPPPKRSRMSRQRNAQLAKVAEFIAEQTGPAMLLGDLNITSWSPHFQDLLRAGRLKDSRQGWGLQPSWPVDRPPFLVPIDHVLVTPGIAIHHRWRGPYTGSDHFPILVEFSLCPLPSSK